MWKNTVPHRWFIRFFVSVFFVLSSFQAFAQEEGEDAASQEEAPEVVSEEDQQNHALAFRHFQQGLRLGELGHWEAALAEFEESLRYFPTGVVQFNRCITLKYLHRYQEALENFQAYLEQYADEIDEERRTYVQQSIEEIQSLFHEIFITVNVDGASIFIDEMQVGTSPLQRPLQLLSGPHVVEVRHEDYRSEQKNIVVVTGQPMRIDFQLTTGEYRGSLRVVSNVAGAEVIINGEQHGHVPFQSMFLEGDYEVEVRADGYYRKIQTVTVARNQDESIRVDLKKKISRGWFWSMVGVTIVGALATTGLGLSVYLLDREYYPISVDSEVQYTQGRSLMLGTNLSLALSCSTAIAAFVLYFFTYRKKDNDEIPSNMHAAVWGE